MAEAQQKVRERPGDGVREVLCELQRRLVRPLEIVDENQERADVRAACEELTDIREQKALAKLRWQLEWW